MQFIPNSRTIVYCPYGSHQITLLIVKTETSDGYILQLDQYKHQNQQEKEYLGYHHIQQLLGLVEESGTAVLPRELVQM